MPSNSHEFNQGALHALNEIKLIALALATHVGVMNGQEEARAIKATRRNCRSAYHEIPQSGGAAVTAYYNEIDPLPRNTCATSLMPGLSLPALLIPVPLRM